MLLKVAVWALKARSEERTLNVPLLHEPPRMTRDVPDGAPVGFVCASEL